MLYKTIKYSFISSIQWLTYKLDLCQKKKNHFLEVEHACLLLILGFENS